MFGFLFSLGHLGDTWVFNTTGSGWKYLMGSKNVGQSLPGTIENRIDFGSWVDVSDNNFYVFGGASTAGTCMFTTFILKLRPNFHSTFVNFCS